MISRNPETGTSSKENKSGIVEIVDARKRALGEKISVRDYQNIIKDLQTAQKTILLAVIGDKEYLVQGNTHTLESSLNEKNKFILRDLLYSIGILYAYENESDPKKIQEGIELLSPDTKDTDGYTLKIIIERRNEVSPFFIKKIEIIK